MPPQIPITITRGIQICGQPLKNYIEILKFFENFFLFLFSNFLVRTLQCKFLKNK
jgi:hypothetical protein